MAPTITIAREFTPESELINSNYEHIEITEDDTIPVIDFSLLISGNPKERSKAIKDLGKACEEWGFFLLINHGIPENVKNSMLEYVEQFFKLPEEEMRKFQGKNVMDPVRCGTRSLNNGPGRTISRGYIKLIVHPEFHFPDKPAGYR
ncbi:hypothetical protein L6164_037339 [Bauhinia variegata]|uniref:Uncharacterized protein n=1 Tax=Bauhinia variegata TaxID=167791 RepID=A0ACB9KJT3_BAUVA|nr:hypothetical protein L6164_037339 [Bauhinia variegata]